MTQATPHAPDQDLPESSTDAELPSEQNDTRQSFTVHRDKHVDSEYQHVTLVTDRFIATFHRNRDELATLLGDNLTVLTEDTSYEDLIEEALSLAEGNVAPVIKYSQPIETAVRWGCLICSNVYEESDEGVGTPCSCPDCDALLVREGSDLWLSHDGFPTQRIYRDQE